MFETFKIYRFLFNGTGYKAVYSSNSLNAKSMEE